VRSDPLTASVNVNPPLSPELSAGEAVQAFGRELFIKYPKGRQSFQTHGMEGRSTAPGRGFAPCQEWEEEAIYRFRYVNQLSHRAIVVMRRIAAGVVLILKEYYPIKRLHW
jgi:hypothetical protein